MITSCLLMMLPKELFLMAKLLPTTTHVLHLRLRRTIKKRSTYFGFKVSVEINYLKEQHKIYFFRL